MKLDRSLRAVVEGDAVFLCSGLAIELCTYATANNFKLAQAIYLMFDHERTARTTGGAERLGNECQKRSKKKWPGCGSNCQKNFELLFD